MSAFGAINSASEVSVAASSSPTPGATINIDASTANLFKWTAGETETVNITAGQKAGRVITLMVTNDAVIRTITLGTGIVSAGTIVGTALKTAIVVLQSDGTNFYELSRTLGL
jgi:cellulase/cellobiase CelA1